MSDFVDKILNEAKLAASIKSTNQTLDTALSQWSDIQPITEKAYMLKILPLKEWYDACVKCGFSEYMAEKLTLQRMHDENALEVSKMQLAFAQRHMKNFRDLSDQSGA